MRWTSRLAVTGALATAGAAFVVERDSRFRADAMRSVRALFRDAKRGVRTDDLELRLARLPPPIRRHLAYAIAAHASAITTAHMRHKGTFRMGPKQSWSPVDGEQFFLTDHPGFVWFARLHLMPGLWIQACDRLVRDRGQMLVKPLSAFSIADAAGREIDQGAALRWLAETPWFPYALVGESITWEAIDERSARASLQYDGLPVQATFDVDAEGKLVAVHAMRYRDTGSDGPVLTSWSGRYAEYRTFSGFRVPTLVEATWNLPEGPFTYARFEVTALEYNVPAPA